MFCSTCGEILQITFKFCPKCGTEIGGSRGEKENIKVNLSLDDFKEKKARERASFFRTKPRKFTISSSGQTVKKAKQEDLNDIVKINVGIMIHDGEQLRSLRGKGLTLSVPKNCTADILLKNATDKHNAHSKNVMKQGGRYILLYPDGTEVNTLKESSEKFVLYKYRDECGKPYHRLSFFLCSTLDFSVCTLEQCLHDTEDDENLNDIDKSPEGTENIRRCQDSDDELPVILDITTSQKQKKAKTSEHDSQYNLETLKEMFPSFDEAILQDAIDQSKDDINLAVSCILEGRSSSQPVQSPQQLYASFSFCNDVCGDNEFAQCSVVSENDSPAFSVVECGENCETTGNLSTAIKNLATQNLNKENPLRIKVRRSSIWQDAMSKLGKCTILDLNSTIKIQFVGEPAVDEGGPRNEFFSLLHQEIMSSGLFTGNEKRKLFNHNFLALEDRCYFMYRQLCSMSIMQGSTAPSFFSPTVADYIVTGQVSKVQTSIQDIPNLKVRNKLEEIENMTDAEQFKKVASYECPFRFKSGFSQPTVGINDKEKMLHSITLHYTLIQSLAETDQFIEGLKLNGLLECLRKHPKEAKRLFLYDENQIEGQQLDDLFVPQFSPCGSNKRITEETVSYNFSMYLEDVARGEVKGIIEDLNTQEKSEVLITASMVLQFITGSTHIPPIGFHPKPTVQFSHEATGRKMSSNTCTNTLTLPATNPYIDYKLFKAEFTACLLESPGFGNV